MILILYILASISTASNNQNESCSQSVASKNLLIFQESPTNTRISSCGNAIALTNPCPFAPQPVWNPMGGGWMPPSGGMNPENNGSANFGGGSRPPSSSQQNNPPAPPNPLRDFDSGMTDAERSAQVIEVFTQNVCATDKPITVLGVRLWLTRAMYDRFTGWNIAITRNHIRQLALVVFQVSGITPNNADAVARGIQDQLGFSNRVRNDLADDLIDTVMGVDITARRSVVQRVLDMLWERIVGQIVDGINFIKGLVTGFVNQFMDLAGFVGTFLRNPFQTIGAIVDTIISGEIFVSLARWVTDTLSAIFTGTPFEAGQAIGRIVFTVVFGKFVIKPTLAALKSIVTPTLNTLKNTVQASPLFQGISNAASGGGGWQLAGAGAGGGTISVAGSGTAAGAGSISLAGAGTVAGGVVTVASGGGGSGGGDRPESMRLADRRYLERHDINAHALKREYLGRRAQVAHYDIYISDTGQLWIFRKGGQGAGIPTHEFIPR